MSDDLVERLRRGTYGMLTASRTALVNEAADEIERLRAENEKQWLALDLVAAAWQPDADGELLGGVHAAAGITLQALADIPREHNPITNQRRHP